MKILGIDPGSTLIGYAFIEDENNDLRALSYGLISIKEKDPILKLKEISRELEKILKKNKADISGLEKLFFAKNRKTAIEVSQARGVIALTLLEHDLEIIELTPMEVKNATTGYGLANKEAVAKMVEKILSLKRPVKEDNTADALAVAIATASQIRKNSLEN